MTSGERISQLHDVARPGELRKGLRLVNDLQTDPPVFTGRTSSNKPGANGGRSSSHSRTTARGIGRCDSSSRVGTTTWHSSSQKTASPCGCLQGTYAITDSQGQTQPTVKRPQDATSGPCSHQPTEGIHRPETGPLPPRAALEKTPPDNPRAKSVGAVPPHPHRPAGPRSNSTRRPDLEPSQMPK